MIVEGGFVDIQVNGYGGVNFSRAGLTLDDVRRVSETLAARGTGAFCPTVVTASLEVYEGNLPVLADAAEADLPARVIGIHVEGPFISPEDGARGAHALEHVRPPGRALYDRWQELARGRIVLVTLAPEVDGALDLVRHVAGDGRAAVGIGHTLATRRDVEAAVEAGARFSTHLGNGIPSTIGRHENAIWPQLAEDRLFAGFITDGHHLPPDFIRTALRAKGRERFVVTSDSSSVAGLPPGEYGGTGGRVVLEPGGKLRCADSEYLAGSSARMLECMNHLASLGLERELGGEAGLVAVGRGNPLAFLGVDPAGMGGRGPRVVFDGGRFTVGGTAGNG